MTRFEPVARTLVHQITELKVIKDPENFQKAVRILENAFAAQMRQLEVDIAENDALIDQLREQVRQARIEGMESVAEFFDLRMRKSDIMKLIRTFIEQESK